MAIEDAEAMFSAILEGCRADGLKPPFIVCLMNAEGAMRLCRLHEDGRVEMLAKRGEPEKVPTVGMVLDQSGQHRAWTIGNQANDEDLTGLRVTVN
jgi:hypothetical protein